MDSIRQVFGKGEIILAEGTQGDRSYLILKGEVLICKKSEDGKQVPIAKLGPGDILGEMFLLDSSGRRSATAVVSSEGLVVEVLFQDQIEEQIQQLSPQMGMLLKGFNRRLRNTTHMYVEQAPPGKGKQVVELPDGTMKVIDSRLVERNHPNSPPM